MIYPKVPANEWAEKYKISLDEIKCLCGASFVPSVPIAMKGYRGLTLEDHGCGANIPFRIVPIDEEKLALWNILKP